MKSLTGVLVWVLCWLSALASPGLAWDMLDEQPPIGATARPVRGPDATGPSSPERIHAAVEGGLEFRLHDGHRRMARSPLTRPEGTAVSAAFHPVGKYPIRGDNDHTVILGNTGAGALGHPLEGHAAAQALTPIDFTAVSVGLHHTCGVQVARNLVCWGDDRFGQAASPDGTFATVSAGAWHTCGVRTDGSPRLLGQ